MRKIIFGFLGFVVLGLMAIPTAQAGKTTYVYTDRRINLVKRVELSKKELKGTGNLNHPYAMTTDQMAQVLGQIKLNKKFLLNKEVETQEVFDERAIGFLAPLLVEGFREAKPNEKIVFSYLDKNPQLILRNDRVTIGEVWITGDQMHLIFNKLMAKMFGDYDKRGEIAEAVGQAKGLRVSLEPSPGYELGAGH